MLYDSTDWSIEIPDDWDLEVNDDCTTFTDPDGVGVLQISSYRKDELVTDYDLREFADDVALTEVAFADLRGLYVRLIEDEISWTKWWLRSGHQMIFATYCCPSIESTRMDSVIVSLVESLIAKYGSKIGSR